MIDLKLLTNDAKNEPPKVEKKEKRQSEQKGPKNVAIALFVRSASLNEH